MRSHVYAQFGETLTGLTTVRAYGKQAEFTRLNENYLDVMNRAYYMTIIDQRWLGIRLDFVGDILIFEEVLGPATGNPADEVRGVAFALTPAELAAADAYEVSAYKRFAVRLKSGLDAFVYVGTAPGQ